MKTQLWKKISGVLLVLAACATLGLHAQTGRGGGGFGGFGGGGFGGGGFGGGGFGGNRGGFGSTANSGEEYNNNGMVGGASIMVDPDTHNIIVVADQATSDQISNVIASLDRPKPQVLIKVVFLQVQLDNSLDLGVEGGYVNNGSQGNPAVSAANIFGLTGLNTVATNFNALGQAIGSGFPVPGTSALSSGGLYEVLGENYQATIRALAQQGKAQVLSRPSILARDGQPATILVGQQVPLVTGISYEAVGNTTVPINNVTYTPVGIQINVTPYVSPDNYVEMIVTPQDSEVDPTLTEPIGGGVNAPVIDTRSADTVVITPDGQTVVIGGLMENDKETTTSKIPLLGDIPLLGALFRSTSTSDNKDELMIFMTPHIVHAPMELAGTVNAPNLTGGFITNSVTEQQLDHFLNNIPVKQGSKGWH
jgi:general secretion pathway protein D